MIVLLRFSTLRHLKAEKARTLLTLTGIALGVALFISIRLANESILQAFRGTTDAVAGRTTLHVVSDEDGLDENILAVVREIAAVKAAAPILETVATVEGIEEPLLILGADPFSEAPFRDYPFLPNSGSEREPLDYLLDPQALFLSETFARAHNLSEGSPIRLLVDDQAHDFIIRGILRFEGPARAMQGNFGLMDIATYQWRLDRIGRLDRIDLIAEERTGTEDLIRMLSAELPGGVQVERPGRRGIQVERMIGAFQLNLTALSAIALLVALFLMYNTMTMAVVRRRTEIGVLRCLGVSTRSILRLFLLEALLIGLLGSLAGVPAGWLLAQWTLTAMGQTVTSLYSPVIVKGVVLSSRILIEGLALGCLVSLTAGLVSVREATRVVPREALHKGSYEASRSARYGKIAALGALLIFAALLSSQLNPIDQKPFFGYASALLLLLALACFAPLAALSLHFLLNRLPLGWTSTEIKLASHSLVSALGRSSMAVTAIMTGLAMMGGMMIMIQSFRATVEIWIDQTISSDLFVIPAARSVSGVEASMPKEVLEQLLTLSGIQAIDPIRHHRVFLNDEQVLAVGRDLEVLNHYSHLMLVNGDTEGVIRQLLEKEEILVSETLAYRQGIQPGQTLEFRTSAGPVQLSVAGIFYDYTTDGGRILMDQGLLRKYWPQDQITTLAVYLEPQADSETVRQKILTEAGKGRRLMVTSNREVRSEILKIFDQTFAITYALEFIAILVAILGVMNTLLTTILERRRELAILRVLGSTQSQMRKIILREAFLLSLIGISLGLAASFLLSQILIHIINKQSFGWSILFYPSWMNLSQAALLILLASLLSAYLPARSTSRIRLTEALQCE